MIRLLLLTIGVFAGIYSVLSYAGLAAAVIAWLMGFDAHIALSLQGRKR
jgi:hypothetical protein